MKKKKLTLAIVGLLSVVTLAACSNGGKDLVTMKGDKITTEDFFEEIKTSQENQQALTSAIIYKVAENGYGDKVDQKKVDSQYKEAADQYGDGFAEALKSNNLTEATYKESIKKNLALEAMLKSHIKLTDEDLKETWKTFHPEVEVQMIAVEDEAKAKEVLAKAKKGDDFGKLAKENSAAPSSKDNGKIKFDSTTDVNTVPEEVKEASYKLKKDDVSDLIKVATNNGMSEVNVYFIVKMVKPQDKGNDMEPFKKEIKKIATDAKLRDQIFYMETIGKELEKANVKIKDDALKGVISQFITEDTKASSTKDSKTKDSKTKDSKTKDSKTKDSKTKDSKTKDSKTKDSKTKESSTEESSTKESSTEESK